MSLGGEAVNGAVSTIGEVLRQHRLAAGLTQQEVAERAGVSPRALRDLEQGRTRQPRARAIRGLADALRLSPAERAILMDTLTAARAAAGSSRIGVLGPLQVIRDGQRTAIPSLRQRTMLGLFALHHRQVVQTSDIIEVVWGEDPPRTVRNLIQVGVSDLRALLGSAGRSLRLANGGYCLALPGPGLDLDQFDDLVRRAQTAGSAGQAAQAADLYAQALSCWRGQVLADADDRLRQHPAAVAVSRRRIAAAVAFADVAIAVGDGDRVVGTLRALSHEDPLHEAVHGRLMLALATTGEQAAALRLYTELRTRLVEELGVEPGAEIRAAHLRVLRAEAQAQRIAVPTKVSASPAPPRSGLVQSGHQVPRQLPREVASFTGRRGEMAALDGLLADVGETGPAAAVIAGTAGVGKTALAVHWAHRVSERFPDGQLFVNLRGFDPAGLVMPPTEAIRRFLDALHVPAQRIPVHPEAQIDLYRTLLADKRMLVVLDNASDPDQVRPLLPGAPGCLVLVTSRNRLTGLIAAEGAHPLLLDLLTVEEAHDLLSRRLGAARTISEPDAVDELVACCARLPLALTVVAASAAIQPHLPLATLADQLRHSGDRLDALSTGDTPTTDLRAVFSWSYQALGEDSARLFRLLGLHPGPDISVAAAASLAALPVDQARSLLNQLAAAHLIAEHAPARYTFHDLLRVYATDLAHATESDEERHAATGRVLDHYLHTAHTAALLLDPARDPLTLAPPQPGLTPEHPTDYQQALDWFTAEHAVLLAIVEHCATAGLDTHTWQLVWTFATFLHRRGHWHDWAAVQHAAVKAAAVLADPAAQARAHRNLALAYSRLGQLDDARAHLRHALDLNLQVGDLIGQAHTHHSFAIIWDRLGRFGEALTHARQALDLFRAAGHRRWQAHGLNAVGYAQARFGDYQQALTYCQQALALHQELGDRDGQAATWDSLGYVHHHLGHHTQALVSYQHAIDLNRDLGNRYREATALTDLGDTHHTSGSPRAASAAWQQALTILDQLDHPDADQVRTKLADIDPQ